MGANPVAPAPAFQNSLLCMPAPSTRRRGITAYLANKKANGAVLARLFRSCEEQGQRNEIGKGIGETEGEGMKKLSTMTSNMTATRLQSRIPPKTHCLCRK